MSKPSHTQCTSPARGDMAVSGRAAQIDENSLTCLDTFRNAYAGIFQGQPASFLEYRPLACYAQQGIDVYSVPANQAILRLQHQTQNHVPVAGVHKSSPALGSRVYLVEFQHDYTALKDYLADGSNVDRILLLKQAVIIVEDLHSKGVVLGAIQLNSFVVSPSGKLLLSGFEDMRVDNMNVPFHPLLNLSLGAMCYLAPEILQSLWSGGHEPLTRATDLYSVGCFAYELFTGSCPLASSYRGHLEYVAQARVIADVVYSGKRAERPAMGSDAFTRFGLTDDIWSALKDCWSTDPRARPSASDFLALITPV